MEFLHVFEFHVNANAALFKLDEHVSEDYVGYDSIYQQTMNELELTRQTFFLKLSLLLDVLKDLMILGKCFRKIFFEELCI